MKILKDAGSFEVLTKPENVIHTIAQAARTCYQSQDKSNPENDLFLVKNLLRRGHHAMIEFATMNVRFTNVSRGFSHEMVRHRMASFAQECLTGDTLIKRGHNNYISIKELYDRKNGSCYGKTHNKTINIKSVSEDGKIINNKLIDVWYKGKQEVYKVKTKLGYTIKSTLNHRFLNDNNEYVELNKLQIGDCVYVNGSNKILNIISDEEFIHYYNELGYCIDDFYKKFNLSRYVVIKNLKRLGIFVARKNDKNKEKYNKNHTKESYEKMRNTIIQQYKNGRKVWNDGTYYNIWELLSDDQKDIARQKISISQKCLNNSNWKDGSGIHYRELKKNISCCEVCEKKLENFEIHHIDKNRKNNNEDNLMKLCIKCHKLLHHGWHIGTFIIKDYIVSIEKINEEDTYDIEMKSPYNNYIANGFVVHNSTRYVDESEFEMVVPPHKDEHEIVDSNNHLSLYTMLEMNEMNYKALRMAGWKPEDARQVLPIAIESDIIVGCNLREWIHIFDMRCDMYAHWEIRHVMLKLLKWCQENIPVVFDDFKYFAKDNNEYAKRVMTSHMIAEKIKEFDKHFDVKEIFSRLPDDIKNKIISGS